MRSGRSLDPFFIHITAHIVIYLRHLPRRTHNIDVLSHTRARVSSATFHPFPYRKPRSVHIIIFYWFMQINTHKEYYHFLAVMYSNARHLLQFCSASAAAIIRIANMFICTTLRQWRHCSYSKRIIQKWWWWWVDFIFSVETLYSCTVRTYYVYTLW